MQSIDIYSAGGDKKKSMELPAALFEIDINWGLMHQAVIMQQSNRRQAGAHVRTRGEVWGSTKKLFQQKHTGRARRGDVRSPSLRGGGKTFGPRNDKNYIKDMPQKMRHAALRSTLAVKAEKGAIVGLESYPETIKTSAAAALMKKLPIEAGRRILFVLDGKHDSLQKSLRNIPSVKCVYAAYLNPEDVLKARSIVFMVDAFKTAEAVFGKKLTKKDKRLKNAIIKDEKKVKDDEARPAKIKKSPTAKKTPVAKKAKAASKKS
jgi:large subunit ribosomal protein L4